MQQLQQSGCECELIWLYDKNIQPCRACRCCQKDHSICGYPPEKGADLWESGIRRYCKHSQLQYAGMLAEHDPGYSKVFMSPEKAERAAQFAAKLAGL